MAILFLKNDREIERLILIVTCHSAFLESYSSMFSAPFKTMYYTKLNTYLYNNYLKCYWKKNKTKKKKQDRLLWVDKSLRKGCMVPTNFSSGKRINSKGFVVICCFIMKQIVY